MPARRIKIARFVALCLFLLAVSAGSINWLILTFAAKAASGELPVKQALQMDTPEFQETFDECFYEVVRQPYPIWAWGQAMTWILGALSVAVFLTWNEADIGQADRAWRFFLGITAWTPLAAGWAWVPSSIRDSFSALAEQGLSAPGIIGAGVGEAFWTMTQGFYLSLILLVVYLVLIFRRGGQRGAGG